MSLLVVLCSILVLIKEASAKYRCEDPITYEGKNKWYDYTDCGNYCRECVALVRGKCYAPHTKEWRRGIQVKGNGDRIKYGTAIATFEGPSNTYEGHAAVYKSQDKNGIYVSNLICAVNTVVKSLMCSIIIIYE